MLISSVYYSMTENLRGCNTRYDVNQEMVQRERDPNSANEMTVLAARNRVISGEWQLTRHK